MSATPGTITGSLDVCPFAFAGTDATYSIRKVTGSATVPAATAYNWSVSDVVNAHIISHPNGAGENDTAITVHFDAGFTSGNISVKSARDCGESAVKNLAVAKKAPATPAVSGNPSPCPSTKEIYTASSATGATYIWTVPAAIGTFTGLQSICTLISSSLAGLIWFRFGPGLVFIISASAAFLTAVYFIFIVAPNDRYKHQGTGQNTFL